MKFNQNKKKQNNNTQKKGQNNPDKQEEVDTHHDDMLKGVDQKFSVFNRKQQRKIKKVEKKQKKQTFFSTNKEQKKQIMIDTMQKQEEEKQIKELQSQQKQQQKTTVDKEELKKKKLEEIEKQRVEREKRQLQEKIDMDDEEIQYFEKLLGKTKGTQQQKKYKKEIANDGWDDDLFSFLDNITTSVKSNVKEYQPFFKDEGLLEDEEIDQLVEMNNAPITLANGKVTKAKKIETKEDDDENPNQEDFTDSEEQDYSDIDEEEDVDEDDSQNDDEMDVEEDDQEDEENSDDLQQEDEKIEDEDDEEQDFEDSEDDENEYESDDEDEDDEDMENDDSDDYEYVEQIEEEKPKKEIKSILKTKNNQENKNENTQQKKVEQVKKEEKKEEKKELSEIEKWRLEKQQKKEEGMTEEEKERARLLAEMEKKDFEKKNQIRKTIIQGYNRLSETNIDIIFKEILEVFKSNPKNLVNPIFADIFMKTSIESVKVMQHIMASNTVVVSAIHQIFDNECFGPIMKALLLHYQEIIQNKEAMETELQDDSINEDSIFNRLRNITIVFSYFYIFDDVSIDFISGYLEHLLQNINQRTIEALLILVQHVGSKIRQDNPIILKNIIDNTKKAVDEYTSRIQLSGKTIPKKIEFIMMTLNDIRLNKKLKTDPIQRLSFFINWLKKNVLQKMKLTSKSFPVDFKYAYNSKKDTPRWYSQFETGAYRHESAENDNEENIENDFDHLNEAAKKKLEQLAIKCRMTTDTRKRIFMLVMSSEDYVDAAQRLFKLKLMKKQSQEIAIVIIQCCAQEAKFNPFYAYLSQKLIEINPKIKFTFQYALWDQFKVLEQAEIRKINNLAKYIALLCSTKSLGITALKFFDLENLSEQTIIFLKIFMASFFKKIEQADLDVQITKACAREENYLFVEGLKDFLKNYYWKYILGSKEKDNEDLKQSIKYTVKKLKIQPKQKNKFDD